MLEILNKFTFSNKHKRVSLNLNNNKSLGNIHYGLIKFIQLSRLKNEVCPNALSVHLTHAHCINPREKGSGSHLRALITCLHRVACGPVIFRRFSGKYGAPDMK